MRVNWNPPTRIHRLSTAAVALLDLLCKDGMRIQWSPREGQYFLWNGTRGDRVNDRTIELLVRVGLLQRDRSSTTATYVITDCGRGWLQANL